ncbi:unnamed protein product, partial [Rotaria sordida]
MISSLVFIDTEHLHFLNYQFELYEENTSLINDVRTRIKQKQLPNVDRTKLQSLITTMDNDEILDYLDSLDYVVIHLLFLPVPLPSSTTTSFEQFGLKLYSTVSQNKKNENIFLSPASISLAMSMCTDDARQETLNQMLKTFEVSSTKQLIKTAEQIIHIFSIANQDKQIQLTLANHLYAQKAYQLQEEYLKIVQNSFKADIKQKDFENEGAQA